MYTDKVNAGPWRPRYSARGLDQLAASVRNRFKSIRYRQALVEAFLAQTGLTLEPQPS